MPTSLKLAVSPPVQPNDKPPPFTVNTYEGAPGMVLIDALVPSAIATRFLDMLAAI